MENLLRKNVLRNMIRFYDDKCNEESTQSINFFRKILPLCFHVRTVLIDERKKAKDFQITFL